MKHRTYGNIKPEDRLQELELIAFCEVGGETISEILEEIDPKLAEEYQKEMEDDEE